MSCPLRRLTRARYNATVHHLRRSTHGVAPRSADNAASPQPRRSLRAHHPIKESSQPSQAWTTVGAWPPPVRYLLDDVSVATMIECNCHVEHDRADDGPKGPIDGDQQQGGCQDEHINRKKHVTSAPAPPSVNATPSWEQASEGDLVVDVVETRSGFLRHGLP